MYLSGLRSTAARPARWTGKNFVIIEHLIETQHPRGVAKTAYPHQLGLPPMSRIGHLYY